MITCYAQPDKIKSWRVLEAFASGCRGGMDSTAAQQLQPDGAAFYGVRPAWMHLWHQAIREQRVWYWLDNSWFDRAREVYFRVGCNAVQSWSIWPSSGVRLKKLGIDIKPWQKNGKRIIVCAQSDEFMRTVACRQDGAAGWNKQVLSQLAQQTDREIVLRDKQTKRPLAADLQDAWLLVTHSSTAAIEALIAGVPVILTDKTCMAAGFSTPFDEIDRPHHKDGREAWLARLADSQWTLDEMKNGTAWNMLNRGN